MPIQIPAPDLQIEFAERLEQSSHEFLQNALAETVRGLNISELDTDLQSVVPASDLSELASRGIRGEWLFACPVILRARPKLIAYYRLLLGFSQKEFYTAASGLSQFRGLEERGEIPARVESSLIELCTGLNAAASRLARAITYARITLNLLDDLALLTFGPQLRGGANVRRGSAAIQQVFGVLRKIVLEYLIEDTPALMRLENATGRIVLIEFAADPDIVIRETRDDGKDQKVVAIEVKGGTDFSNVHNRMGEAEKSHQKARLRGFTECWTVVNVNSIDLDEARRESPSTNQFFRLVDLLDESTNGFHEFKSRVIHLTSIPSRSGIKARKRGGKRQS